MLYFYVFLWLCHWNLNFRRGPTPKLWPQGPFWHLMTPADHFFSQFVICKHVKACYLHLLFLHIVYSTLPSPSEHAIRIGGNFTLPCNMSTDALLIWLKFSRNESNTQLIAFKSEKNAVQIRMYKDQLSLQTSGLLMLHNVSFKNEGLYRCRMALTVEQTFEHEVQLFVGGKFLFKGAGLLWAAARVPTRLGWVF